MNKNGLYQIKKHFWLLYPSKDIAAALAALAAAYWGKQLDCNVTFISPKTVLFPVEMDGKYVKVISGEGVGWIIVYDWVDEYFEEIKE